MEHIFGSFGTISRTHDFTDAISIKDDPDTEVEIRLRGLNHFLMTFGNRKQSSFKLNQNELGTSFQLGQVIPIGEDFDSERSYDHTDTREADGCFVSGCIDSSEDAARLCTDPFGLHPLYYIRLYDGVVFSSSLDALIRSGVTELTLDMVGICQFVHYEHFLGNRTFFKEVKRFEQGKELSYDMELHDSSWDWNYQLPIVEKDITESEDALPLLERSLKRAVQRRVAGADHITCLLSGGFDSRALAAIMKKLKLDFSTHTTYGDEGRTVDAMAAEAVSSTLEIDNHYHDLQTDYLEAFWRRKASLIQHETQMHTWMYKMADELPSDALNIDGLGGDQFLTTLKPITHDRLWKIIDGGWEGIQKSSFNWYWPNHSINRIFKDQFLDSFNRNLLESHEEEFASTGGNEGNYLFFFLRNRNRRGIGCSPALMLSHQGTTMTPYYDKEFVELCLRLDERIKFRGRLHKRLIEHIDPSLSEIPSSHDSEWPEPFAFEHKERYCLSSSEPLDSYLEEIKGAHPAIDRFIDSDWISRAENARDAGPQERAEFLKEAQSLGEICFVVKTYQDFLERSFDHNYCPAIRCAVNSLLRRGDSILEFGAGQGTIELSQDYQVHTIEHDQYWLKFDPLARYVHAPIKNLEQPLSCDPQGLWYDVPSVIDGLPEDYDLMIVNGPNGTVGRSGILTVIDSIDQGIPWIINDTIRADESNLARDISLATGMNEYRFWNFSILCRDVIPESVVRRISLTSEHVKNYSHSHIVRKHSLFFDSRCNE